MKEGEKHPTRLIIYSRNLVVSKVCLENTSWVHYPKDILQASFFWWKRGKNSQWGWSSTTLLIVSNLSRKFLSLRVCISFMLIAWQDVPAKCHIFRKEIHTIYIFSKSSIIRLLFPYSKKKNRITSSINLIFLKWFSTYIILEFFATTHPGLMGSTMSS